MTKRTILVTSALPYANGHIHIGHLVEYIQTDIWVRFQKMRGHHCLYICADDTHGTPIMLSAKKQGISPEELISTMQKDHLEDFSAFHIAFDHYSSTNSDENRDLSEFIYQKAKSADAIEEKQIKQLFCDRCEMFLPDRFVKGTCPSCQAENQYGDACEVCSKTYATTEVLNPKCAECHSPPILKGSNHFFFKLSQFEDALKDWIDSSSLRAETKNKLQEWFKDGLRDWDISRDAPYFGFKIPDTQDKYFYVWLDAPVGYIAATKQWCDQNGKDLNDYWQSETAEIYHFIGKDILYFHALFWPAMLMVSGFNTPSQIHVHGFLTVNGEKMSKSRGTFILAKSYLEHLDPELLRYYYAAKLNGSVEDIDLNLDDFVFKVNADIVNKVVNIGSRLGSILNKKLENKLSMPDEEGQSLLNELISASDTIADYYESNNTQKACKACIVLAEKINKYINDSAPWELVKTDSERARAVCTTGLNGLKIISGYLKPVCPVLSEKVEQFLDISPQTWETIGGILENHTIQPYQRLAERVDIDTVKKIIHQ